jgi:hypothetical protein
LSWLGTFSSEQHSFEKAERFQPKDAKTPRRKEELAAGNPVSICQRTNIACCFCAFAVQYRRTLHFWQNFFSALSAPLRAEVPPDRVLVAARRARPGNLALGTRFFEQEKTERTEHDWNLSISPLPPVRILCLVAACRAAPLRLCVKFFIHGSV